MRELAGAGMTRADHVAALGGGVVGDLAGFCAATYQRGVPVVQVPSSLVAQVDSAYGGKTGVDLPEAKNYVGAYHLPAAVLTDPSLLSTLAGTDSVWAAFGLTSLALVVVAHYSSVNAVVKTELFPTEVRALGVASGTTSPSKVATRSSSGRERGGAAEGEAGAAAPGTPAPAVGPAGPGATRMPKRPASSHP